MEAERRFYSGITFRFVAPEAVIAGCLYVVLSDPEVYDQELVIACIDPSLRTGSLPVSKVLHRSLASGAFVRRVKSVSPALLRKHEEAGKIALLEPMERELFQGFFQQVRHWSETPDICHMILARQAAGDFGSS